MSAHPGVSVRAASDGIGGARRSRYDVLCAWCHVAGVRRVIRQCEVPNSHGICQDHAAEFLQECGDGTGDAGGVLEPAAGLEPATC